AATRHTPVAGHGDRATTVGAGIRAPRRLPARGRRPVLRAIAVVRAAQPAPTQMPARPASSSSAQPAHVGPDRSADAPAPVVGTVRKLIPRVPSAQDLGRNPIATAQHATESLGETATQAVGVAGAATPALGRAPLHL